MIRTSISRSHKIATLSKESAVLFLMLIPHYDSYGKMNGDAHFIKGQVVPLMKWFTTKLIKRCLVEISDKTNVKWFLYEGMPYLHSVNWDSHQKIRQDRIGKDVLPDYSGTTPRALRHEVEVEVEVKEEVKEEVKVEKDAVPEDLKPNEPEIRDWLQYKREKGQRYKPTGLKALWNKIRAIPKDKRKESIDHSMANGWAGLYIKPGEFNGNKTTRDSEEIIGAPKGGVVYPKTKIR